MAEPALAASLEHCPADAWQVVAPQLFAQLSSPQPAVRRIVGALLRVLGQAVPVAVLYPAVVEGRIAVESGDGLAAHPELQVRGGVDTTGSFYAVCTSPLLQPICWPAETHPKPGVVGMGHHTSRICMPRLLAEHQLTQ